MDANSPDTLKGLTVISFESRRAKEMAEEAGRNIEGYKLLKYEALLLRFRSSAGFEM